MTSWVDSVVNISASHSVGCVFAPPCLVIPCKDHHKNGTNCFPAWHGRHKGRSFTVQPDCLKGWVVCGTVYGDMHLKDLLGSIVRVMYILVSHFYLVLHGL